MKHKIRSRLVMSTRLSNLDMVLIAMIVIAAIAVAVFHTGLNNPFMGDDNSQIVLNVPVHSIRNIRLFFEGGTFYDGGSAQPLVGAYYRPLMTTVFSLLYTLFGPHSYYFHFVQLLLCIGGALVLFLFFKHFFGQLVGLFLALLFLLHPINSQIVYSIPNMQDALYFFFGLLALYMLVRFQSIRSLVAVCVCLLLSLLSKESAILFIVMAIVYLYWWNRKRLYPFMAMMVIPVLIYLGLRLHAIGVFTNPHNAPIDSLGLASRLLSAPSIVLFYITKFVFPVKLASAYYWTVPYYSVRHVLIPICIDLLVVLFFVYLGLCVHRKAALSSFHLYVFFAIWSAIGLSMLLQILPLDMTVSESWFYFPMVGILGMMATAVRVVDYPLVQRVDRRFVMFLALALIVFLGVRSSLRGYDWSNQYRLAFKDISASSNDYVAYNEVAIYYYNHAQYQKAETYASKSVAIYPTATNSNVLGTALLARNNFAAAAEVFKQGLRYPSSVVLYDDIASLTSIIHVYGSVGADQQFITHALTYYPHDANLWFYLAILEYRQNDRSGAQHAITEAYHYAPGNADITIDYFGIMTGKSPDFTFNSNPEPY